MADLGEQSGAAELVPADDRNVPKLVYHEARRLAHTRGGAQRPSDPSLMETLGERVQHGQVYVRGRRRPA